MNIINIIGKWKWKYFRETFGSTREDKETTLSIRIALLGPWDVALPCNSEVQFRLSCHNCFVLRSSCGVTLRDSRSGGDLPDLEILTTALMCAMWRSGDFYCHVGLRDVQILTVLLICEMRRFSEWCWWRLNLSGRLHCVEW